MARKYDFETSFITLSARVNEEMPYYVAESVVESMARQPVSMEEAEVLILGVAFKGNVADTRRSPAGPIIRLLREKGVGTIRYHDPHVESYDPPIDVQKDGEGGQGEVPRVELTPEMLREHDVAVIVTDHDAFDGRMIAEHAPAIVDTRNALGDIEDPVLREKITLLGAG